MFAREKCEVNPRMKSETVALPARINQLAGRRSAEIRVVRDADALLADSDLQQSQDSRTIGGLYLTKLQARTNCGVRTKMFSLRQKHRAHVFKSLRTVICHCVVLVN